MPKNLLADDNGIELLIMDGAIDEYYSEIWPPSNFDIVIFADDSAGYGSGAGLLPNVCASEFHKSRDSVKDYATSSLIFTLSWIESPTLAPYKQLNVYLLHSDIGWF